MLKTSCSTFQKLLSETLHIARYENPKAETKCKS